MISAAQVRAGRALLGWSQAQLAEAANVAASTIADYEREARTPTRNNLAAIQAALAEAGVQLMTFFADRSESEVVMVGIMMRVGPDNPAP